ncbi:hypothetical protein [Psittacicella melopsittaci]|uniref:hypothetical protein n=1 Tax=Psittacicella melopsittaci TaxID=2028576 RepID=UPI001CA62FDE|nr:hypothetical protein [Psittacicella melopsittaci]
MQKVKVKMLRRKIEKRKEGKKRIMQKRKREQNPKGRIKIAKTKIFHLTKKP